MLNICLLQAFKKYFLYLILLSFITIGYAGSKPWESGEYDGYKTYTLTNDNNDNIILNCYGTDTDNDITLIGDDASIGSDINDVYIKVNGKTIIVPKETSSREGANAWYDFVNTLNIAPSFEVYVNDGFFGVFVSRDDNNVLEELKTLKQCIPLIDRQSYNTGDSWYYNFIGGIGEYYIQNGKESMAISCTAGDTDNSVILADLDTSRLHEGEIMLKINNKEVPVPNETNSRVGAGNWEYFLEKIMKAESFEVYIDNKLFASFRPENANEALKDLMSCEAMFTRDSY